MDLPAALAYLDDHVNLEATAGRVEGLSLERMRALTAVLGDPQHAFRVIHITGTNGKGSVTRIVTELMRESGLAVGTYTSPHLERVNERLAYDGVPIGDEELAEIISHLAAIEPLLDLRPSYFELLTAAAFRWFADRGVDVAVVEVGLLGRWDATNVVDSDVAVLTNIGHDHTDGEGDWRRRIAAEKAGIVKPESTFVLGEVDPDLADIFTATPAAELWRRDLQFGCNRNDLALGGRVLDLYTPDALLEDVLLPLHGSHQGDNAAIALAAAEAFFGRAVPEELVREAFAKVQVPGRFEIVHREPLVILDGAHNIDGAEAAAATLREEFTLTGSLVLVVGMLAGRDPAEMLEALGAADAGYVIACTAPSPRAIPAAEVAAVAERLGVVAEAVPDVAGALARALSFATSEDAVVVSGSLYVVGAARSVLRGGTAEVLA